MRTNWCCIGILCAQKSILIVDFVVQTAWAALSLLFCRLLLLFFFLRSVSKPNWTNEMLCPVCVRAPVFPFHFNYFSCLDCYLWELQIKFEWQFGRIQGCCMYKRSHTVNYTFSLLLSSSSSSKCSFVCCGLYCCWVGCCCYYFCVWWWFWFAFDALTHTSTESAFVVRSKAKQQKSIFITIGIILAIEFVHSQTLVLMVCAISIRLPPSPPPFLGSSTSHLILFLRCSFLQHVFLLLTNDRLVLLMESFTDLRIGWLVDWLL